MFIVYYPAGTPHKHGTYNPISLETPAGLKDCEDVLISMGSITKLRIQ